MSTIELGTSVAAAKAAPTPVPTSQLVSKDLTKPEGGGEKAVRMTKMTRSGVDPVYGDYNIIDEAESNNSKVAKMEMWIAKKIGTSLTRAYPKRQWGVRVDVPGGAMVILCPSVSNEKGYHLHLKGDTINDLEARSIRAAGEILERYGISRERNVNEQQIEADLKLNFKDEALAMDAETMNPGNC